MAEVTIIQLNKRIIAKIKKAKEYPKQTYNKLLDRIVSVFIAVKKKDSYDEFLHKIQQPKMKELLGNKEDGAWETSKKKNSVSEIIKRLR